MRCINKGAAPKTYAYYKEAKGDLTSRIGWFCAYCEMPVKNMIEVEHIHPVANGGDPLRWENFLLCCRYCNAVKRNNNAGRAGYLWPDTDNTILAFEYSAANIVSVAPGVAGDVAEMAQQTINLMGLDRRPGGMHVPTGNDTRWQHKTNAWGIIEESYQDWTTNKIPEMARAIARTASGHGFYSCWIKKFRHESIVIDEINRLFPNTYQPQYNDTRELVIRHNGLF